MTIKENILNRKFIAVNSFQDIDAKLNSEKQKDPIYIHYLFTMSPNFPQYFILAYIPKPNYIIKEYIKIKPKGLFFHNLYFYDLNEIAKYFKTNYSNDDYRSYVKKTKPPTEEGLGNLSNNNYTSIKNNEFESIKNISNINIDVNKLYFLE